jgi:hypothetical protein
MKDSILHIHHILQFIVPAIIAINAGYALACWRRDKPYTKASEVMARVNIGFTHLQMLFGIILLTHSTKVLYGGGTPGPGSAYWSWVHPGVMFGGVIFVTLALLRVRKKKGDTEKHRLGFIFNALALAFMLAGLALMPKA